ncbi:ArsA family ATPase [Halorientalis regularis]|uniref:Arsenite-transporting ATPase n=1 Tax=Halorientalis regularis TaxID=660518 RepID=A0A1G7T1G8_9EURY|nr:TRC40/GET3/ArsA family transport-energizing ATPase [Halorientalis regularis]SDG28479.1 arsenite-transporting ATPase [Halorientalis regularis]
MTEFVLFGGKGGVGKTTVAAASGLSPARSGHEALVVSTDPAHSLSDSIRAEIGGEPTEIRERLFGVEVDPNDGLDRYQEMFETMEDVLEEAGVDVESQADGIGNAADLFSSGVVPGSDELAGLSGLARYVDTDDYDYVVFDTAPTGHTLRLLDLPGIMADALSTAAEVHEQVQQKANVQKTLMLGLLAIRHTDDPTAIVEMRERMDRVESVLRDPEMTTFHVVTIPETMAVEESVRLAEQLPGFEVPVGELVVNKFIEDPGDCERCRADWAVQEDAIDGFRDRLPGLDVQRVADRPGEVTELETLDRVAEDLTVS